MKYITNGRPEGTGLHVILTHRDNNPGESFFVFVVETGQG